MGYENSTKAEKTVEKAPAPALGEIPALMHEELKRMDTSLAELKNRLNNIYSWDEPRKDEAEENKAAGDILTAVRYQVYDLQQLNQRLEHIVRHARQIA